MSLSQTLSQSKEALLLFSNISNNVSSMKAFDSSEDDATVLSALLASKPGGKSSKQIELKLVDGNKVTLSASLEGLLRQLQGHLALGRSVSVVEYPRLLTTQEAADFVGVSRPTLIGFLDKFSVPHQSVGKHRKISLEEVRRLKDSWTKERGRLVSEMRKISGWEEEINEGIDDNPLISR